MLVYLGVQLHSLRLLSPNCPAWQRRHSRTTSAVWAEPRRQWISAVIRCVCGCAGRGWGREGRRMVGVFGFLPPSFLQSHSVLTSCLTDSATVSCSESGREAVCQEDEQEGGLQLSFLASDGAVRAKSIFLTSIQSVEWLVSVLVTWKVIVGMSVQLWPLITEEVSKFNSNLTDPWHRRCRQEFNILQK